MTKVIEFHHTGTMDDCFVGFCGNPFNSHSDISVRTKVMDQKAIRPTDMAVLPIIHCVIRFQCVYQLRTQYLDGLPLGALVSPHSQNTCRLDEQKDQNVWYCT